MGRPADGFEKPLNNAFMRLTHMSGDLALKDHEGNKLVLLLRDYKECIASHGGKGRDGQCAQGNYWANLNLYHNWSGPKKVVYYEDLMTQTIGELKELLDFFELSESERDYANEQLEILKDNLDESREQSFKRHNLARHDPTDFKRHSLDLSDQDKEDWKERLRSRDPEIYDTYLSRYAT